MKIKVTLEWVKVLMPLLIAGFAGLKGCEAVTVARATDSRMTAFVTEYKFQREVHRLDRRVDAVAKGKGRAGSGAKGGGRVPGASPTLTDRALTVLMPWRWFRG